MWGGRGSSSDLNSCFCKVCSFAILSYDFMISKYSISSKHLDLRQHGNHQAVTCPACSVLYFPICDLLYASLTKEQTFVLLSGGKECLKGIYTPMHPGFVRVQIPTRKIHIREIRLNLGNLLHSQHYSFLKLWQYTAISEVNEMRNRDKEDGSDKERASQVWLSSKEVLFMLFNPRPSPEIMRLTPEPWKPSTACSPSGEAISPHPGIPLSWG